MYQFIVLSTLLACSLAASVNIPSEGRIVGGEEVDIRTLPYQVSIQLKHRGRFYHICGGTILDETTVVSAAHCFYPRNYADVFYVRVGSNRTTSGGQFVPVTRISLHYSYDSSHNDYDVSLLKLSENLEFNEYVQKITLDDGTASVEEDVEGVISGWGATMFHGSVSRVLLKAVVPIVAPSTCQTAYATLNRITGRMFCAGHGDSDSCQGDSGGPFVVSQRLVGIVSWGYECGRPNFPGVYTRVSEIRSWIEEVR